MKQTQIQATREVKIEVSDRTLQVKPLHALIRPGGGFPWVVTGLARGQTLEVDFQVYGGKKGPFAHVPTASANTHRGRYEFARSGETPSNQAEPGTEGYWKYDVILRDIEGRDIAALDPGVMVKDDNP